MKILLDECITKRLKPYCNEHEVYTVTEMGWSGIKNGKLMSSCVENHFDLLLTIDKNLQFQQNLDRYPITIVVLNSFTSKVEELITFLPELWSQLPTLEKHKAYLVDHKA